MNECSKKEAIEEAKASLEIENLYVSEEILDKVLLDKENILKRKKGDKDDGRRRNKVE